MHGIARYSVICLLFCSWPASASFDIAGLSLPTTYGLAGQSLVLNGAGIRSKFFFKIYVGALYLAKATHDPQQALNAPGAKSMQMMMLYKEVDAAKIAEGWRAGFKANLSPTDLAPLTARLQQFNALFPTLHKGDHVYMDYVPGAGTTLTINKERRGAIAGEDFFRALLQVWIGDQPADTGLKSGLLGD
ncbi:MAG: chalcone isomerase family protein [Thiogranum sp.]